MARQQVLVDPTKPIDIIMRVNTPLFAEVSIYYRPKGETRWTEAAFFNLREVEGGNIMTTVPVLVTGTTVLLRVLLWGGKKSYIINYELQQNRQHCQGSPLAEVKGTAPGKGIVEDVEVDLV